MTSRTDSHIKEQVREANDIVTVVEQCVPLRKAGSNFKACCPFHDEKTPSFNVHPAKQIWHCFGCGEGGDVFSFVMRFHGMAFPEALRYLAQRVGITLPEARERSDGPGRADVLHVSAQYMEWFQDQLLRQDAGKPARDYLQARGFHSDVARTFGLGFAPDQWTAAAEAPALRALDRSHVTAAGLAKPRQDGSLYDLFRNRIIFPIHGPGDDVVAFGGRTIGDDDPAKYINSPETVVYRKGSQLYNLHRARRAIQQTGRVILVEGYFDAIRLATAGFEESVATCGTALTEQQAKLLGRYTDQVLVAYDGDASGRTAAERAAGLLLAEGLDVRLISVPDGADPDDYLRSAGAAAFRALVDGAVDVVDFVLSEQPAGVSMGIEDRVRFADRLGTLARRISHPARRSLYVEKIAAQLRLDRADVARSGQAAPTPAEPVSEPAAPAVSLRESEREPLRVALRNLDTLQQFEVLLDALADFPPVVQRLVRRIVEQRPAFPSFGALIEAVEDDGERQILRELEIVGDARNCYPLDWLVHLLNLRRAEKRISDIKVDMGLAEAQGNESMQTQLATEFHEMGALKERSRSALETVEVEHALV